jgi:hypothetical protein
MIGTRRTTLARASHTEARVQEGLRQNHAVGLTMPYNSRRRHTANSSTAMVTAMPFRVVGTNSTSCRLLSEADAAADAAADAETIGSVTTALRSSRVPHRENAKTVAAATLETPPHTAGRHRKHEVIDLMTSSDEEQEQNIMVTATSAPTVFVADHRPPPSATTSKPEPMTRKATTQRILIQGSGGVSRDGIAADPPRERYTVRVHVMVPESSHAQLSNAPPAAAAAAAVGNSTQRPDKAALTLPHHASKAVVIETARTDRATKGTRTMPIQNSKQCHRDTNRKTLEPAPNHHHDAVSHQSEPNSTTAGRGDSLEPHVTTAATAWTTHTDMSRALIHKDNDAAEHENNNPINFGVTPRQLAAVSLSRTAADTCQQGVPRAHLSCKMVAAAAASSIHPQSHSVSSLPHATAAGTASAADADADSADSASTLVEPATKDHEALPKNHSSAATRQHGTLNVLPPAASTTMTVGVDCAIASSATSIRVTGNPMSDRPNPATAVSTAPASSNQDDAVVSGDPEPTRSVSPTKLHQTIVRRQVAAAGTATTNEVSAKWTPLVAHTAASKKAAPLHPLAIHDAASLSNDHPMTGAPWPQHAAELETRETPSLVPAAHCTIVHDQALTAAAIARVFESLMTCQRRHPSSASSIVGTGLSHGATNAVTTPTVEPPFATTRTVLPPPRKRVRLQCRNEQKRDPSAQRTGREDEASGSISVTSAKSKVASTAELAVPEPKRPRLSIAPKPANAVPSRRLGGQCRNETFHTLDNPIHNVLTEHNAHVETLMFSTATRSCDTPTKIPVTATTMSTNATIVGEPPSLEPIDAIVPQNPMSTECDATTQEKDAAVSRLGKRRRRRWDCRPETTDIVALDVVDICSPVTIQALDAAPLLAVPGQPNTETASLQGSASSSNGPKAEHCTDKEHDFIPGALLSTHHRRRRDCMADSDDCATVVPSISSVATGSTALSAANSSVPEQLNPLALSSPSTATSKGLPTSNDKVEQSAEANLAACFDSDEDEPTFF